MDFGLIFLSSWVGIGSDVDFSSDVHIGIGNGIGAGAGIGIGVGIGVGVGIIATTKKHHEVLRWRSRGPIQLSV